MLHGANTLAITQQKKRHLSPVITRSNKGLSASNQLQYSAGSSGSKKNANAKAHHNQSPSLRHLKNTKLALQEKAKYYEQQRLNINNTYNASAAADDNKAVPLMRMI